MVKPKVKPDDPVLTEPWRLDNEICTVEPKLAVDSWIDELDRKNVNIKSEDDFQNVHIQMLIQQRLPSLKIPLFDGSAANYVPFISSFNDMVNKQPYLDVFQKLTYLMQHLIGEPTKAVDGFAKDVHGYISSLKQIKYIFGNPCVVAQATIQKVTHGGQISDTDQKSLTDFYYAVSSCLNTLTKMNYTADIYSTDVLRQTLRKLPNYLIRKLSEYSFHLWKREEPKLIHLENWLQARVMSAKDPYLPNDRGKRTGNGPRIQRTEMNVNLLNVPVAMVHIFSINVIRSNPNLTLRS